MAYDKLSGGRVKQTCLVILNLALLLLAACTQDASLTGSFKTGDDWIRALNQQGVACKAQPNAQPDRAIPVRLIDFDTCRLDNGDVVNVLIVKNATQAFRRYYAGSHGPHFIFYRSNWLAFTPASAPAKAVSTIRQSFKAMG